MTRSKPKLLDLFCGAGGAAMGYHRAGFEVVGVDYKPQPRYPFEFHLADAREFPLEGFDCYHASPPCQGYSHSTRDNTKWVSYSQGKQTPRIISEVRKILEGTGKPFLIENVLGAEKDLQGIILLCGQMFGLPIIRHRYFYSNFPMLAPGHPIHNGAAKRYAESHNIDYRLMSVTGKGKNAGCLEIWKRLMGIDWNITQTGIVEAIPPAYTEYIGKYLIQNLRLGS